jgi:hypothetical protein
MLMVVGNSPDQVFGFASVSRIGSSALNLPVDLTPVHRDMDNVNWASNSTGIAASVDASTIFATFVDSNTGQGGVLAMPAF